MKRISEILKKNESSKKINNFFKLLMLWRKAMPLTIISVTSPIKLETGNLLVLVHDNIWLTELSYLKEELIEQLNKYNLNITSLTFKYSPAYIKKYKPKLKQRKLTEIENVYIENYSKKIDNEELRRSFQKAMYAYFQSHDLTYFKTRKNNI